MSELVVVGGIAAVVPVVAGGAALWRCVRAAVKAEESVAEVPTIRQELAEHRDEDRQRFDAMERTLSRIESRLDVIQNDVAWLKDERRRGGGAR